MAQNKNGVGIWSYYRTTDRADGLSFSTYEPHPIEAKLYWAPTNWQKPENSYKRPYMVVLVKMGKMDRYGHYEYELRRAGYVGDERPRRNWKELCSIASGFDEERIKELASGAVWYHERMLSYGCKYYYGTYEAPEGESISAIHEKVVSEHKAMQSA